MSALTSVERRSGACARDIAGEAADTAASKAENASRRLRRAVHARCFVIIEDLANVDGGRL